MKTFSVQWLSEQIRHHSETVLLLDTRCSEEYSAGCILSAVNVYCCGALILRRLKKGNVSVESLLSNEEDKSKYSKAKESESITVIVYDEGSTSLSDLASDSLTALLLKKLSRDVKNFGFLEGGYNDFSDSYSRLCTGKDTETSSRLLLQQQRPSSLVLQLDNLTVVSDSSDSDSCSSEGENSGSPPSLNTVPPQPFEILSHLYLGCRKAASDKEVLKSHSISRVLNVTSEESQYQHLEGFSYYQIAVEDTHEVDMLQHLPMAFAFIEEARLANEKVLVHCHAGMSRSVTVVISYLMKYYSHSLNSAYDYVRQKKSNISPNFSFLQQLIQFESSLQSTSPSDSGIDSESCSPIDNHYALSNVFTSNTSTTATPSNFRRCILAA